MGFLSKTMMLGEEAPQTSSWILLKRIMRDLLRYKLLLGMVAFSIAVYTATSLTAPYVLGSIIDKYVLRGRLSGLAYMVSIYFLLLLGQWASATANSYGVQVVGQLYLRDLRNRIFSKLQRLSLRFYADRRIGDLISATINDTSTLNDVLVSGILSVMGSMFSLAGIVAVMLYLSPRLTLVAVLNIPLLIVIARVFGRKLREAHRTVRRKVAEATMVVEESVAGIHVIKAFGRESDVERSFASVSGETAKAYVNIARLMGLFWPSMDIAVTLSVVLVLIYGAYLASIGAVTVGLIIAFIQYVNRMGRPITQFINMYDSLQAALAAAERIYAVIDSEEVEKDDPSGAVLEKPRGEIIVRNVSFSYVPGRPVLRNVNMHVRPGETVALVGSTGAGKTTLASLIMRFHDPSEGEILVDGIDVRRMRLSNLRRIVSYVPQETYLFPGTVMENIRLGKPDASDEEIVEICRKLGIHEFIDNLPKGYRTDVGEMGKKLSTGEKQLIAIARAMLRRPAVVILDEALSSVDPATEAVVRRAMRRLLEGRTGIIIAHRLSTAREADRIFVMENGSIVEEGSHEELLRRKGRYYELYKSMVEAQVA